MPISAMRSMTRPGAMAGTPVTGTGPGPCSSARALVEDAGEQRDERVAFGGRQGVQDVVLLQEAGGRYGADLLADPAGDQPAAPRAAGR
jgi:hypothetical protein